MIHVSLHTKTSLLVIISQNFHCFWCLASKYSLSADDRKKNISVEQQQNRVALERMSGLKHTRINWHGKEHHNPHSFPSLPVYHHNHHRSFQCLTQTLFSRQQHLHSSAPALPCFLLPSNESLAVESSSTFFAAALYLVIKSLAWFYTSPSALSSSVMSYFIDGFPWHCFPDLHYSPHTQSPSFTLLTCLQHLSSPHFTIASENG